MRRRWLTKAAVSADTRIPSSLSSRSCSAANASSAADASPARTRAPIRSAPADSSSGQSAARRRAQSTAAARSPPAVACFMRSRSAAAISRPSSSRASITQSSSSSCSRSPRHRSSAALGWPCAMSRLTSCRSTQRPSAARVTVSRSVARYEPKSGPSAERSAQMALRRLALALASSTSGQNCPASRDREWRPGCTASQPSSALTRLLAGSSAFVPASCTSSSPITRISSMAAVIVGGVPWPGQFLTCPLCCCLGFDGPLTVPGNRRTRSPKSTTIREAPDED